MVAVIQFKKLASVDQLLSAFTSADGSVGVVVAFGLAAENLLRCITNALPSSPSLAI
jgi:hypothetical protein